ncbi:hypothetical protein [Catalinimonas niigatensis]|uniref:hypothetical protein n=1 Tax=Catalinimonas niigatensis TaxID=1397264 RepID=UPI002666695E|nr:hypothetical protein [Catalinimonas niigatensis]WPP49966.1 hypothetical protein PZB72_25210 [Catalinimonas niigatensis]
MKFTIIALTALATFSFATIDANAFSVNQDVVTEFVQDGRTEIQYEELPEAVRTAFEEAGHSEMDATTVFEVQTDEGVQYEVSVSDGTDTTTMIYDAEGNEIVE